TGSRVAFSSGFDSIPFDLGVLMLQTEARARFGSPAPRVKCRVRAMQGGVSGGTAASLKATLAAIAKEPALGAIMASPFGLTPGFT
ncbi:saccharopine dehydrogenase, partial [Streptomyces scabiei]